MLNALSGFDSDNHPYVGQRISRLNIFALCCLLVWSSSFGYLVYASAHGLVISVVAAVVVFLLLCLLHFMVVSGTGPDATYTHKQLEKWKSGNFRLCLFIALAAIFSQFVLMAVYVQLDSANANGFMQELERGSQQYEIEQIKMVLQQQEGQLDMDRELLARLKANVVDDPVLTEIPVATSLRRKALIVLNSPSPLRKKKPLLRRDAQTLAIALREIGFSVEVVQDANLTNMELSFKKYLNSLAHGDISFVYFSGQVFQDGDTNYLVPAGSKNSNPDESVGLNIFSHSLELKRLASSVLVLDVASALGLKTANLADPEVGPNSYVFFPAPPGQPLPKTAGQLASALSKQLQLADATTSIDTFLDGVRKTAIQISQKTIQPWWVKNAKSVVQLVASDAPRIVAAEKMEKFIQEVVNKTEVTEHSCEEKARGLADENQLTFLRQCIAARIERKTEDLQLARQCRVTADVRSNGSQSVAACIERNLIAGDLNDSHGVNAAVRLVDQEIKDVHAAKLAEDSPLIVRLALAHGGAWRKYPFWMLFVSFVLCCLGSAPFLIRDRFTKELRDYEIERARTSQKLLSKEFLALKANILQSDVLAPWEEQYLSRVKDSDPLRREDDSERDTTNKGNSNADFRSLMNWLREGT